MLTLGIETSCDETGLSLVKDGFVLSSVVSSSVDLHKPYGGIVPEIASRYHVEYISPAVREALKLAGKEFKDIKLVAVTRGPGLAGSLLPGIAFAKAVSFALGKPLVGVNHLSAHLYANFLNKKKNERPVFPCIGLVVSGGHTSIYLMNDAFDCHLMGSTQDDAVGEAFDKVAKILGLGYPGGPIIERLARDHAGKIDIKFPKAFFGKDSLDFSFSGIKTSVLYYVNKKQKTDSLIGEVSYAFQEAVFDAITRNVVKAVERTGIKTVLVGGGVACNKTFGRKMHQALEYIGAELFIPEPRYALDNGAMVAAVGEALFKKGVSSSLDLAVEPNLEEVVCTRC